MTHRKTILVSIFNPTELYEAFHRNDQEIDLTNPAPSHATNSSCLKGL